MSICSNFAFYVYSFFLFIVEDIFLRAMFTCLEFRFWGRVVFNVARTWRTTPFLLFVAIKPV